MVFIINDPGEFRQPVGTILVIDDDPKIQSVIRDCLANEYLILTSDDGILGINKAQDRKPDLILLDVLMPRMNGCATVKHLFALPETKNIPVVIMTAKDFDDGMIHLLKREPNVAAFLPKPFQPKTLRKIVHDALKKEP